MINVVVEVIHRRIIFLSTMKSKVEGGSQKSTDNTKEGNLRERKVAEESKDKNFTKVAAQKKDGVKSIVEAGGSLGVFCQVLFAIVFTLTICIMCDKSHSLDQFKNFKIWFSWRSLLIYYSYLLLQFILAFIPCCGKKTTLPDSGVIYTANGVFNLFIILFIMIFLEYFNIRVFSWIFEEYFALYIISVTTGILLSICAYIRSSKVPDEKRNPYGNSGSFIYDFCMGRQVNTYFFGKINLKLITNRCSLSACVLYNVCFLYLGTYMDNDTGDISVNPTLFSLVCLICLYLIYFISEEDTIHLTFEYHSEATGVILLVGYALYPYAIMCIGKCILENNIHLSPFVLCASVMLSLIGQYIIYASNKEKNMFRTYPDDDKFKSITSIPTPSGKRLMTSGWWGIVRHPNYFGEIILHLGWCIPVLSSPIGLYSVIMPLYLMLRAKRDGDRCHRKHGAAWETYCNIVPYSIIPGIF